MTTGHGFSIGRYLLIFLVTLSPLAYAVALFKFGKSEEEAQRERQHAETGVLPAQVGFHLCKGDILLMLTAMTAILMIVAIGVGKAILNFQDHPPAPGTEAVYWAVAAVFAIPFVLIFGLCLSMLRDLLLHTTLFTSSYPVFVLDRAGATSANEFFVPWEEVSEIVRVSIGGRSPNPYLCLCVRGEVGQYQPLRGRIRRQFSFFTPLTLALRLRKIRAYRGDFVYVRLDTLTQSELATIYARRYWEEAHKDLSATSLEQ